MPQLPPGFDPDVPTREAILQALRDAPSPLSPEELNNGCFDTNWFFEVYEKLGEKTFGKLYKAAKYIADGSKHTRARKYADAAVGKRMDSGKDPQATSAYPFRQNAAFRGKLPSRVAGILRNRLVR